MNMSVRACLKWMVVLFSGNFVIQEREKMGPQRAILIRATMFLSNNLSELPQNVGTPHKKVLKYERKTLAN